MAIIYNKKRKTFAIHTPNTTYICGIYAGKHLIHLYYGSRMDDTDCTYLFGRDESEGDLRHLEREEIPFYTTSAFEYPAFGTGDYRDNTFCVRDMDGHDTCQLYYESYCILNGKPALDGLPATFAQNEQDVQTLEITLRDPVLYLTVLLRYSVFGDCDSIMRSVRFINESDRTLYLERVPSACLDMQGLNFTITTLQGGPNHERNIITQQLTAGKYAAGSICGKTSHEAQPFIMAARPGASQKYGEVYAMQLVYSGNFLAEAEADVMGRLRLSIGINPQSFCWKLEPNAYFDTPEAVLVYSDSGIGTMSRRFHNLYRKHLIRSPYLHRQRPILINNWEATYYDFTDEKLVAIAKKAHELGIEMLVMDDGWFGKRNNDESSLGDWTVNDGKIKGGLKSLVERINVVGMKFGIWLEPEMISPDSELYRAHPDWPIQISGRHIGLSRCQYVLDITRPEVEEYVYGCISRVLHSANIAYVKWDMNRSLANVGSAALDCEHAGEFYHRYVLALYRLQERMLQEFPALLLENCCGGGGRFDAGMLYYSPQIWASDNMDPVQRLQIQEGTAMTYPLSTIGAHICCSKNHHTGRITPLKTRANVAMCGTFGYELDVTTLTEKEEQEVVQMNKLYHKYNDIYREGEYYRIASYRENQQYDCWQVVSEDKTECLVTYVQPGHEMVWVPTIFRLEGLIPNARYRLEGTDKIYSGEMLMNAGYRQEDLYGDHESVLLHFVVCQEIGKRTICSTV